MLITRGDDDDDNYLIHHKIGGGDLVITTKIDAELMQDCIVNSINMI